MNLSESTSYKSLYCERSFWILLATGENLMSFRSTLKNNLPTELDYGPVSMGCTFYGELPIAGCSPPQIFQDRNFFSLCYVA